MEAAYEGEHQEQREQRLFAGLGRTPIPDPTLLTTAALTREVAALQRLMETRLDAMDRAQTLFDTNLNRVPSDTDKQVAQLRALLQERMEAISAEIVALKNLHDEKFASVQTQFKERDTRAEREGRDNKVAVDAAFAAQKEASAKQDEANQKAIDKSEKATAETLGKQADLFKSTTDALAANISETKERLTRVEAMRVGSLESTTTRQSAGTYNLGLIMAGFGLLNILLAAVALFIAGR